LKTKVCVADLEAAGQRIDKWLLQFPEISSRSFAQDLILKSLVLIDNKPVKASHILKANQVVTIQIPEIESIGLIPYDFPLDIIHEDNDLLVINKPSGLVTHPAAGHEQDTLVNALINYTNQLSMKNELRPGIVHRIDKETSGLLVVAKNDFAHDALAIQFKEKTAHRIYYAVVEKLFTKNSDTIQSYLARHPVDRKRYASVIKNNRIVTKPIAEVDVLGKWASTQFKIIATAQIDKNLAVSYVQLKLETGRTHQIRVHMSEINHPLVGDLVYGGSKSYYQKLKLNRFFLHAAELGFVHPRTQEKMLFKISWPQADQQKLQEFGFHANLPGM